MSDVYARQLEALRALVRSTLRSLDYGVREDAQ
jgi:hypothetical protein